MFDIAPTELLLCAVVALLVIGPKDLPRVMRTVGQWVARARGMARHFRSGIDTMIREAELQDMEKKWAEENARIMARHPEAGEPVEALPAPESAQSTPADPASAPADASQPAAASPAEPELPLTAAPKGEGAQ
ncbi:MAG: twin arginine-targeting protein translocase TatB [Sphingomonas sp. SCN 67-18]|uniref:Sec-independent protein translocase protein TatB n=1 Tax=uncultured Sphingomonas sp. TaxID=158754 RepID=UPI00086F7314|nr:Sec-independent protein translocase protein TatB [Sphingomonas sp. SCN 67-18]ODU19854.1 MAG: twin arginine-targeting protein translocase TatB [Sphingomonas sp. SCN 67-18]